MILQTTEIIWFYIIILMVVAGTILRFIPMKLSAVRLRQVGPSAAARLVSEFILSSCETDFGYPSGYFRIEQMTGTEVVAKEWVAKGSHFTQILAGLYRAILGLGSAFGCLGMYVMLCLAVLVTPLLVYAALTETLLKYLLRSQIVAALRRDGDGTQVTFTIRGPSALLLGRRLVQVFREPPLPGRIASLARIAPESGTTPTGTSA